MLNVTSKPFMLSVVTLSVVAPNLLALFLQARPFPSCAVFLKLTKSVTKFNPKFIYRIGPSLNPYEFDQGYAIFA
jgi:hypothetical protein